MAGPAAVTKVAIPAPGRYASRAAPWTTPIAELRNRQTFRRDAFCPGEEALEARLGLRVVWRMLLIQKEAAGRRMAISSVRADRSTDAREWRSAITTSRHHAPSVRQRRAEASRRRCVNIASASLQL